MAHRVLIACLGNIFLGDDGFGVEVAQRLAREDLPEGVHVGDYGVAGMHLAYDLAQGWDTTIVVDAARRGGRPGTVYVIEPETVPAADADPLSALVLDPHGMQPDVMFRMAGMLGAQAGRVLLVGCEPASQEEGIGLSGPVAAAVDEAVRVVMERAGPAGGRGRPTRRPVPGAARAARADGSSESGKAPTKG